MSGKASWRAGKSATSRPGALSIFWADGIYFQPRMEHDKQCILVIIGADQWGRKELLAIAAGYRESAQSWRELLLDLKRRGLEVAPELAVGDGARGFWKALRESHGTTREQRCWLHKTGNVLNKLPKSLQAKAKGHRQDIWMAETKDRAEQAFDFFLEAYGAKYDKATACLAKDRAGLLTSYDFPAEHWKHLRTTTPIESTCATVRLRTIKTTGCLSRTTAPHHGLQVVPRLKQRWERHGYDGLVDYRGGKPRRTRIALATIEQVCTLKRQRYPDFSVQHFWEQLGPVHGLEISYTWYEAGPAGGRASWPRVRGGRGQYRRRRERRPLCGMMVHLDASRPGWLPQLPMQDLVVAMDDADGRILYARFVPEENTASTLAALKHLLRRYGRFAELYTDRASHFCYTPKAGTAPPTNHGGGR